MKDTDQMLIGTAWIRTAGRHGPHKDWGTIDDLNTAGPRLKLEDGSHRRLKWMELGFSWEPKDNRSSDKYEAWKLVDVIDRLDTEFMQNGNASIMTEPEVGTKECHGPWHRHSTVKGGAYYDLVPLNQFSVNSKGKTAGQLSSLCNSCREKQRLSDRTRKAESRSGKITFKKVEPVEPPEPVKIEPGIVTNTGVLHSWRITVVQPTEHIVHAKDFLDAAAQVSGLGEITRVEKL